MAFLTLNQLVTPLTSAQIRATMVQGLTNLGIPAGQWPAGGVASTILTVTSIALALVSSLVAQFVSGFFLTLASESYLAALATNMYGVVIPPATFANGFVTLTNTGGAIYNNVAIGALVLSNPATGVKYTNTVIFSIAPGQSIPVPVQATTIGSAGSTNPNTITNFISAFLGLTATNPSSLVGLDTPSDPYIRQLCLNALAARSVRGPRNAYGYAVQTATNINTGQPVNINRYTVSPASHTGAVTVWVASPSGAPDPNDVAGVAANIEALVRPEGITVTVVAASVVSYSPTIIAYVSGPVGTQASALQTVGAAAISNFMSGYPIGGQVSNDDTNTNFTGLFASGIYSAIGSALAAAGVTPVSFQGGYDLSLPAGTVAANSVSLLVRLLTPSNGTAVR